MKNYRKVVFLVEIEHNTDELQAGERIYPKAFNEVALDHRERYQLALNYIKREDKILDAATGVGYGAYYMAVNSNCEMVVGIDINDHAIEWGKKYFTSSKNHFVKADLLSDISKTIPVEQFDLVTCFETIEHITDEKSFLNKIHSFLKPGGMLLISSPNEEVIPCLQNPFYPGGKNPHHHRHYTPHELKQLLIDTGFSIVDSFTQCPHNMIRGENGFVIVYVCINLPNYQPQLMNPIERGIEKLNIVQMRKTFSFLENKASTNIQITTIDDRIDEILNSYDSMTTAHDLIDKNSLKESLTILENIDKSLCPESYFFLGMIYQIEGHVFRALEMYSKVMDNKYRLSSIITSLAEEQLVKILSSF
jgi:SAM-dependent methyltransferase